jgi:CheY-like chemotaxis protein
VHFTALIIDADGKTPATLKNLLGPYGFEFTVTENGPEAVNIARQAAPDIILLRAELPLTTGFSVCNRLRRNDDTRKIPLVLYSSNASDDVIEQHRNLKTHADHYLKLPLDPERLLTAVRAHLKLGARASTPEPAAKPRPRLDVELTDASPPAQKPAAEAQFDREFGDQFDGLAEDARRSGPQQAASRVSGPEPVARGSEASGNRRLSQPDLAALADSESSDGGTGGFKAQREALQLKSQLNAKNREILSLKEQLEARERAILDAKKLNRDLQTQAGEFEAQLLTAQEQMLEAREAADVARRDMQTSLKREEGQKSRLEVTQKKLKETENDLAAARQHAAQAEQAAAAAAAEARGRIETQTALIADLEAERDDLVARLAAAHQQVNALQDEVAGLTGELTAARDELASLGASLVKTRDDSARALADARTERDAALAAAQEDRDTTIAALLQERDGAVAELSEAHRRELEAAIEAHRAELARQDQTYRAAAEKLTLEAAEAAEQAQAEQNRLSQALVDAEENARLQISQLTQTLSATEETARAEIQRLTHSLAAAEEAARAEIQRLTQQAAEAAEKALAESQEQGRRITIALADIDELGVSLDRSETALHRRKEAASAAQQALAVALRLLEEPAGEAS